MERLFAIEVDVSSALVSPFNFTRTGAIAQLRAAVELLDRGYAVALPMVDDAGVDLVVNHRIPVQVKSSGSRSKTGMLHVNLESRSSNDRRVGVPPRPNLSPSVEVLMVYARDTGTWWIIPISAISEAGKLNSTSLSLTEHATRGLSAWRDAWEVFD